MYSFFIKLTRHFVEKQFYNIHSLIQFVRILSPTSSEARGREGGAKSGIDIQNWAMGNGHAPSSASTLQAAKVFVPLRHECNLIMLALGYQHLFCCC